jgi:molybdopterin/thiamine biosynthesis adenylyltransferase
MGEDRGRVSDPAVMEQLRHFLRSRAEGDLIPWAHQEAAAVRFGLGCARVEEVILEENFLPARYQRNRAMISTRQQQRLFRSRVVVVGCGGLGGYILEQLARLGIGRIVALDPDIFEENNLNRQLLSSPRHLGRAKVELAAERIAEINPAVTVEAFKTGFSRANGGKLFAGADCVVDATDNVQVRLDMEAVCSELGIPLVHGAIAGWYGHVATVYPGEKSLGKIYRHWTGGKGVEQQLGNPSFTPAVAASLEVAEVCKVLLGQGGLLRNRKLSFNLLDMEVEEIPL